jgi:hypothetical protein
MLRPPPPDEELAPALIATPIASFSGGESLAEPFPGANTAIRVRAAGISLRSAHSAVSNEMATLEVFELLEYETVATTLPRRIPPARKVQPGLRQSANTLAYTGLPTPVRVETGISSSASIGARVL